MVQSLEVFAQLNLFVIVEDVPGLRQYLFTCLDIQNLYAVFQVL